MKPPQLTRRELDIMSVLWEKGEATVTEVRDRVDPDLAYTSVSTMIRTLELKGYVSHRRGEGKTHIYFPIVDAETAGESALGRVLNKSTADRRSSFSRTWSSTNDFRRRSSSACASCSGVRRSAARRSLYGGAMDAARVAAPPADTPDSRHRSGRGASAPPAAP